MIEFRAVQDGELMDNSPAMSSVLRVCRKCGAEIFADAPEGLDRKSTRLNSSHVSISYAVFCLKKSLRTLRLPKLGFGPVHPRPSHPRGVRTTATRSAACAVHKVRRTPRRPGADARLPPRCCRA